MPEHYCLYPSERNLLFEKCMGKDWLETNRIRILREVQDTCHRKYPWDEVEEVEREFNISIGDIDVPVLTLFLKRDSIFIKSPNNPVFSANFRLIPPYKTLDCFGMEGDAFLTLRNQDDTMYVDPFLLKLSELIPISLEFFNAQGTPPEYFIAGWAKAYKKDTCALLQAQIPGFFRQLDTDFAPNFQIAEKGITSGLDVQEYAFMTPTGKVLQKNGFTIAVLESANLGSVEESEVPGISVLFLKKMNSE